MTTINGISLQPKIGSDFALQYGESASSVMANTMANTSAPSAQFYDTTKITQNSNPEKIAENLAKYDIAQGNYMKQFHKL